LYSVCVMDEHRKTSCLTPANPPLSAAQRTPSMMRLRDYLRVSPPLSVTGYVQSHRICIKSNRSFLRLSMNFHRYSQSYLLVKAYMW
jgi:hypothetical protein